MVKWRLIVSGRVQGVGYRALVKQVASGMPIKGQVKNREDGTVEIFCECEPKEYEVFKDAINVQGDVSNLFSPSVREIKEYMDGTEGFDNPPSHFGHFVIDYGVSMTPAEKETIERSEIGILALSGVNMNIKHMVGKQDTMNEKLENIANATIKTHNKLDNMNGKLNTIANATVTTHEKLESIDNRLGDALNRYDVFGTEIKAIRQDIGDMKLLASEFREFKDLFAIYVKHQLEKDSK